MDAAEPYFLGEAPEHGHAPRRAMVWSKLAPVVRPGGAVLSLRLRNDRIEIGASDPPATPGVALAASPPAAITQQSSPANFEFGFWLQKLTEGQVPGWLQKSRRAFLKLVVDGKPLDDDQVRRARRDIR